MKKIFVLSVGRSDYDRYYPILSELNKNNKVNLFLYLSKVHQNRTFGKTIKFVNRKFKIMRKKYKSNNFRKIETRKEIINNFSDDLLFLSQEIKKKKPDLLIVLGDRYEMLIGPVAAAPYNIPVIHFFGGAVTEGAIDELIRHSITKMSHFHFVALEQYKKRLIQLGEEKWRVIKIGMHQLNFLKSLKKIKKESLCKKYNFNFFEPYLLVTYHPVTLELKKLDYQLNSLSKALKKTNLNVIFTYPNADPGYDRIIKFINEEFKNRRKYKIFKNAGSSMYANLIANSKALVGNSSSGIVEAASFKKPAVNIGTRQDGKFMPKNVINTGYNSINILNGIKIALSKRFNKKIKNLLNPYESNISIKKIVSLILNLKKNDKLLRKKFIDKK
tara:strand:- start:2030 stop:3190 length:1161 start_codon:yes stop_codon:yes gene_type:complete